MGLANTAKNEGWQSALIFCLLFHQGKSKNGLCKAW
jgi:hypothetical protein